MTNPQPTDAERMDRHYRYQRFIYDATRTHYLIGRRHLIADLKVEPNETILEIGCGTAWNLVRTAKLYPQARLYGIDVSKAMLDTARASIRRQGLDGRIKLAEADATLFSAEGVFGTASFDRVFFSYALSMIPRWRAALSLAAAHVAPGGRLHNVDFGQCEALPAAFKGALFAFLEHYTVTPRADLKEEARRVAAAEGLALSFVRLHRGYTDYAVLTRPKRSEWT